jgi:hypothetical protein
MIGTYYAGGGVKTVNPEILQNLWDSNTAKTG